MPFAETRAGRVFYAEHGDGPPVVLLHATLHDHADFDALTGPLADAGYRTLALDWPGHGQSSGSQSSEIEPSASLLADVLADFVAGLDLPPAVFIGNSVGGYAAARLALDQPERVAGLVLVNSGGFVRPTVVTRTFCRALGVPRITRLVLPPLVPRYMRPVNDLDRAITKQVAARARTAAGARVAAALWRSFNAPGYDLRAQAKELAAPVLIVCGTRDIIAGTPGVIRQAQAAIPGAELRTLETGHVVFASDPGGFLDAIMPFLAAALASRTSR
jgi:pimeloyl-ACP methyl ester carboxylesterase